MSISEYANDSFKENSREECEALVETIVAGVGKPRMYEGGGAKKSRNFSPHT